MDKLLEFSVALAVESFERFDVNVGLHILEVFDLEQEALDDICLTTQLPV